MTPLQIVALVDAVLNLAATAGINFAKLVAMREESGGELTEAQREELANEAHAAIDAM